MLTETAATVRPNSAERPQYQDIVSFLVDKALPPATTPGISSQRVYVHEVCSVRNVMREEKRIYQLLARLPGIELLPLPENSLCCGAGGTYFLDHPDMADSLLNRKISGLDSAAGSIIVTTNTPCAIHFRAGLRARGIDIEVMHPIRLLSRRLGIAGHSRPA